MITFLALLALTASAEPLKPVRVLPAGGGTLNSRYVAHSAEPGRAGLWDMRAGRQIALFEPEGVENRPLQEIDGAVTRVHIRDVSSDGALALVALNSMRWTSVNNGKITGKWALLIMSVAEQKLVRQLAESRWGECDDQYGVSARCPSVEAAKFSPDGSKILYWTDSDRSWNKTAKSIQGNIGWSELVHKHRMTANLAEASGRKLGSFSYAGTYDSTMQGAKWEYSPTKPAAGFLNDGRAVLAASDDSGCVVKEWGGKALSFPEDCSGIRELSVSAGLVWSPAPTFIAWDPATGTAKYRYPAPLDEKLLTAADELSTLVQVFPSESSATVRIIDAASGKTLVERAIAWPAAGFDLGFVNSNREDSRLVVRGNSKDGYTGGVYQLGAVPTAKPVEPAPPSAPSVDFDVPPSVSAKTDPDAYAGVIGVEKYRQEGLPGGDYASRDAEAMYAYLTRSMGFDSKNVALLTNERASKTDLEKHLGSWLKNRATANSRVFVYYAGHGSPNPASGEGYLMPYEADPSYLEDTAYPISKLYGALGKLPAKEITVVLDACFSGQGGRSLIAKGSRPLVQMKDAPVTGRTVVLAAATGAQISAADTERRHGLLTGYLLEALHGGADADGDGKITGAEVYAFVRPKVERAAKLQNVEQTPTVSPSPEALSGSRPWIILKK